MRKEVPAQGMRGILLKKDQDSLEIESLKSQVKSLEDANKILLNRLIELEKLIKDS